MPQFDNSIRNLAKMKFKKRLNIKTISKQLEISTKTIKRWHAKFRKNGKIPIKNVKVDLVSCPSHRNRK